MKLLAIDPGETTGWSVWDTTSFKKLDGGQHDLWQFIDALSTALVSDDPPELDDELTAVFRDVDHIVCEDWRIYPKEAASGALDWDSCRTARGIGAIELIVRLSHTGFDLQGANIKEAAVAAGAEEDFVSPTHENRHENDSTMHAVYWMVRNA